MYHLQYFVPTGHPKMEPSFDEQIMHLCASLRGVDKKCVPFPQSALSIQLILTDDGGSFEIRKRTQLVYINIFCFEISYVEQVFSLVHKMYQQYQLGIPTRPKLPSWIHSIPINPGILQDNEVALCTKITVSFFWAAYAQLLRKRNPLN